MAKTLSTQAPPELYARVEELVREEGQTTSQVVLAAVDFWTQLPPETHLAIRRLMAGDQAGELVRHVVSDALDLQFNLASARVAASMRVPAEVAAVIGPEADDAAFLDAADAVLASSRRR